MALRSRWRRFESCRRRFLGSSDLSGVRRTMTGHSRGQGVAGLVIMGVPKEDSMSRLIVRNYSISLDGYGAGPHQDPKILSGLEVPNSTNGFSLPAAAVK